MRSKIKDSLYFLLFGVTGAFIYKFQIDKSFNLLSIYLLCVTFSCASYFFRFNSKKALPILFIISLFMMYGLNNREGVVELALQNFVYLLIIIVLLLIVLLADYKLTYKKFALIIIAIPLLIININKNDLFTEYKFIPFVIGSFFMFRSINFLYDTKFMKRKASTIDNINFFLLIPNFYMPLFPIVDYKTFIASYEGINTNTLRRSSALICLGLLQMMLYRFIYHDIIIPFDEIRSAYQVFIFLIANFMIVLRVIGAFNIAIGLVVLTGYNIPDIFNNIFFSTGFSNLWRRTNIYWRNFMIKIFYYPIYFKIKKIGVYKALFLSTLICFFITWILHTYQWFWLKGSFPIELKDAIFWGSFGLLVSTSTLLQQRNLEKFGENQKSNFDIIRKSISGLIVLFTISVLWSIWTSNSLSHLWSLFALFKKIDFYSVKIIFFISIAYIFIASCYHYFEKNKENKTFSLYKKPNSIFYAGLIALFVVLVFSKSIIIKGKTFYYWTRVSPVLSEGLNKADQIMIDNGYYTNLISTNNYCSQSWINDYDISANWTKYITAKTTKPTRDLMISENIPFASVKYNGIKYTLNSNGLRDIEYNQVKPDSCYRIIILGGSYECGNGMNDGQDFLSLVESELNNSYIKTINGKKIHLELINFSANGYHLIQRYYQLKNKAILWNPDAILLFIHTNYDIRSAKYVTRLVNRSFKIDDSYLQNIIDKRNILKTDNDFTIVEKLGSYADSLNYYAISGINSIAKEKNLKLTSVFLPSLKDKISIKDSTFMNNITKMYNIPQISLADVFMGQNEKELTLSEQDYHPNKKANQLIAESLLKSILRHQDYFNIQFTKK